MTSTTGLSLQICRRRPVLMQSRPVRRSVSHRTTDSSRAILGPFGETTEWLREGKSSILTPGITCVRETGRAGRSGGRTCRDRPRLEEQGVTQRPVQIPRSLTPSRFLTLSSSSGPNHGSYGRGREIRIRFRFRFWILRILPLIA